MYIRDTIAAIATPLGAGGIAIVRVSGPESEKIGNSVFAGSKVSIGGGFESHRLLYGHFIDPRSGSLIDEGMCVLMRAPKSYTCEDVLELHCHGGYYVVRALLQACLVLGARLAAPGEFTRRAFLNGRIDLAQAESVADVISSRTDRALALAQLQRKGGLSSALSAVRASLVDALALIEAYIDFPEDEVDPAVLSIVDSHITVASARIFQLVQSYTTGKVLREGVSVLLLGRPNAGKSSLLNAITGTDRAIVSDIPGTTRDFIEEIISIDGLPVKIIDAAGIREHHEDCVEQEGVRRALGKLPDADLVLFLIDGSVAVSDDDRSIASAIANTPYVVVITKTDLPVVAIVSEFASPVDVVSVSSRVGLGVDTLARIIFDYFISQDLSTSSDCEVVSHARHRDILLKSSAALAQFNTNRLAGLPLELLSLDLRSALLSLGEVTGETTTDEVLDAIFSSFCIGK
jgi:tRNA modification GTPase